MPAFRLLRALVSSRFQRRLVVLGNRCTFSSRTALCRYSLAQVVPDRFGHSHSLAAGAGKPCAALPQACKLIPFEYALERPGNCSDCFCRCAGAVVGHTRRCVGLACFIGVVFACMCVWPVLHCLLRVSVSIFWCNLSDASLPCPCDSTLSANQTCPSVCRGCVVSTTSCSCWSGCVGNQTCSSGSKRCVVCCLLGGCSSVHSVCVFRLAVPTHASMHLTLLCCCVVVVVAYGYAAITQNTCQ